MLRLEGSEWEEGWRDGEHGPGFVVTDGSILERGRMSGALEDTGEVDPLEGRDRGGGGDGLCMGKGEEERNNEQRHGWPTLSARARRAGRCTKQCDRPNHPRLFPARQSFIIPEQLFIHSNCTTWPTTTS